MRARAASSILALAILSAFTAASAQTPALSAQALVRFDPAPAFKEASRKPEPLDAESFIDLCVRASLVEASDGSFPSETGNAAARIVSFVLEKSKALKAIESPYERGAETLAVLHRERLRAYRTEQTRVDLAMDSGAYNCVSSAILYMALAKAAGLETSGVETTDHAFAMVMTEKGWIDVETTNPYGFDPGKRKEVFTDSFGRVTGYAYVPPEQYSKRFRVGDKEMAGLILHNRVSSLESDGLYRESFDLAVDRYALEGPDAMGDFILLRAANLASRLIANGDEEAALSFLDAYQSSYPGGDMVVQAREVAIRNRLARLAAQGKYEEGYAFIERARRAWGEQVVFFEFETAAVKNRAIDLIRTGEFRKALDFLDENAAAGRGDAKEYPGLRENAAVGMINAAIRAGNYAASLSLIEDLSRKAYLGAAKRRESFKSAAGMEANRLAKTDPESGWLSAKEAFEDALAYLPGDPDLLKNAQACLDNYAAAVFNRFAAAYNSGKRSDALRILKEGLSKYPDSPLLKKQIAELEAAAPLSE